MLIYFIVDLLATMLHYVLGPLGSLLSIVVTVAVFVSGIAVALKRLHDRDKPGWWLLIFYIAPVVLFTVGSLFILVSGILARLFYLAGLAIAVWSFIELGCLPGTAASNEYGPDPLKQKALA